jgi:conjugative transfer signal peptidase TraF
MRLKAPEKSDDGKLIVSPGEMLVFVAGHAVIKGTQSLYFRDPVFAERVRLPAARSDAAAAPASLSGDAFPAMSSRRFAICALLLGAALAGAGGSARLAGLRVNTTPSMPVGLWQVSERPERLQPGEVVSLCPDDGEVFRLARVRGYRLRGNCDGDFAPLIKPVVAVAGDRVTVSAAGLAVNGQPIANSRAARVDAQRPRAAGPLVRAATRWRPARVWVVSSLHAGQFRQPVFRAAAGRAGSRASLRPLWVKEGR